MRYYSLLDCDGRIVIPLEQVKELDFKKRMCAQMTYIQIFKEKNASLELDLEK